ncbi:MAG TPA: hypothetical protein VGG03_22190 [Thermoanaerobaculia bacterium]
MAFTLNLTIRGLCALVPRETIRFGERHSISKMKVLVLDARQKRAMTDRTPEPLEVCAHDPMLVYDHPEGPDGVWLLDGHRLEISDVDTEQPLEIQPSFKDAARLELVVGGRNAIIPAQFLTPDPPPGIVANLDLVAGPADAIDPTQVWEFLPPPTPPYSGRFASAVRVLVPIKADAAVLRGVPVQGGRAFEDRVRPKGGRSSVDVMIRNICPPQARDEDRKREDDFAVFYDCLPSYTGALRVPHRVTGQGGGQGGQPGIVLGQATVAPGCVFSVAAPAPF